MKRLLIGLAVAASSLSVAAVTEVQTAQPAEAYCTGWACNYMDPGIKVRPGGTDGCTFNWDMTVMRCTKPGTRTGVWSAPYGKHFVIRWDGVYEVWD